jgi:hypothetical protein
MLQRYSITLILACSMRLVPKSEIRYSTVRPQVAGHGWLHQPHGHRAGSTQVTMGARISRFNLLVPGAGVDNFAGSEVGRTTVRPQGAGHGWPASAARAPCRFNSGHDGGTNAHLNYWCPGPGSNRHGVATEGFSYPLQFSLLCCGANTFGVWTFSLPYPMFRT